MPHRHEGFLNYLSASGWIVQRAATAADAPGLDTRPEHLSFLRRFSLLCGADETTWFLSAGDYAGTTDSAFAWNEFERLSLDAALDAEDRARIASFWARHLPILLSVAGDYAFLAIDRATGAVVHGVEPEFEATTPVASSLEALFEAIMEGRILQEWFS